jgi:hypothetical protein
VIVTVVIVTVVIVTVITFILRDCRVIRAFGSTASEHHRRCDRQSPMGQ